MTTYIVLPTTSGAASWPRLTPVEKVKATCRFFDVVGVDLVELAVARAGVVLRRHRPLAVLRRRRGGRGRRHRTGRGRLSAGGIDREEAEEERGRDTSSVLRGSHATLTGMRPPRSSEGLVAQLASNSEAARFVPNIPCPTKGLEQPMLTSVARPSRRSAPGIVARAIASSASFGYSSPENGPCAGAWRWYERV